MSYFACLIVILALALDPFTQQIVHYNQPVGEAVPDMYSEVRHSQLYDRGPMNKTNVLSKSTPPWIPIITRRLAYRIRIRSPQ